MPPIDGSEITGGYVQNIDYDREADEYTITRVNGSDISTVVFRGLAVGDRQILDGRNVAALVDDIVSGTEDDRFIAAAQLLKSWGYLQIDAEGRWQGWQATLVRGSGFAADTDITLDNSSDLDAGAVLLRTAGWAAVPVVEDWRLGFDFSLRIGPGSFQRWLLGIAGTNQWKLWKRQGAAWIEVSLSETSPRPACLFAHWLDTRDDSVGVLDPERAFDPTTGTDNDKWVAFRTSENRVVMLSPRWDDSESGNARYVVHKRVRNLDEPERPATVAQVVAEAGQSTEVFSWTPQRVAQAIAALKGGTSVAGTISAVWGGTGLTGGGTDGAITLNLEGETYTTAEKAKVSALAANAEENVQSDWDATQGDAFIKNKPSIPVLPGAATPTAGGLMSAVDKAKLNTIDVDADVNVQSDWSASSGITAILNKPTVVSQSEAQAGTGTDVRLWTPQRVAQAIAALGTGNGNGSPTPARSDEEVRDLIVSMMTAGAGISLVEDDEANTLEIRNTVTDTTRTDEDIRDVVANMLTAGANVTLDEDDAANTLTIAASGGPGGVNLPATVSQDEAQAGTSTSTRIWTPQRVAQAIAALETYKQASDITDIAKTVIADWAEDGTTDLIPSNKLTNAPGEANVQADWDVTSAASDAFIKNKPVIPQPRTDEYIKDVVADMIVAGSNVTITEENDDSTSTDEATKHKLTIASTDTNTQRSNAEIDARVSAGVLDWAEHGNTSLIPQSKLPTLSGGTPPTTLYSDDTGTTTTGESETSITTEADPDDFAVLAIHIDPSRAPAQIVFVIREGDAWPATQSAAETGHHGAVVVDTGNTALASIWSTGTTNFSLQFYEGFDTSDTYTIKHIWGFSTFADYLNYGAGPEGPRGPAGQDGASGLSQSEVDARILSWARTGNAAAIPAAKLTNAPQGDITRVIAGAGLTGGGTDGEVTLTVANPFLDSDESKLDAIEAGAEVNVQADWNTTDSAADSFVKNKPTIPSLPDVVSQTDAEAGTGTGTRLWTPQRVAQAIAALASSSGGASATDTDLYADRPSDESTTDAPSRQSVAEALEIAKRASVDFYSRFVISDYTLSTDEGVSLGTNYTRQRRAWVGEEGKSYLDPRFSADDAPRQFYRMWWSPRKETSSGTPHAATGASTDYLSFGPFFRFHFANASWATQNGQDLIDQWERAPDAIIIRKPDGSELVIPGPNHDGNEWSDTTEFYDWFPEVSRESEITTFMNGIQAADKIEIILRGRPLPYNTRPTQYHYGYDRRGGAALTSRMATSLPNVVDTGGNFQVSGVNRRAWLIDDTGDDIYGYRLRFAGGDPSETHYEGGRFKTTWLAQSEIANSPDIWTSESAANIPNNHAFKLTPGTYDIVCTMTMRSNNNAGSLVWGLGLYRYESGADDLLLAHVSDSIDQETWHSRISIRAEDIVVEADDEFGMVLFLNDSVSSSREGFDHYLKIERKA